MPPAIVVDDVWKRYLIGQARYSSLRDTIVGAWRRMCGRPAQSATERTREFYALKGVSFEVEKGTTLGIIGPNGAGKSTLLKLMSRVTRPTRGSVTTHGRVSALIEVGAGFHPELTGRENIYLNGSILGMRRREIEGKFDAIVDFSGLEEFIDTPVKYYSSGMFARLGFSVAAHVEPDILLVDEVLSVGDWGFQQKCFERMEDIVRSGTTIIFVSHNMTAVATLCQRGILLCGGAINYRGDIGECIRKYHETVVFSSASADEHVPSPVSFELLGLFNADGRESRLLKSGEAFELLVEISVADEFPDMTAHVSIANHRGIRLFGTDTNRACKKLGRVEAGCRIKLRLRGQMNLLDGSYYFGCKVKTKENSDLVALADNLCPFQVVSGRASDGIVDLESALDWAKRVG